MKKVVIFIGFILLTLGLFCQNNLVLFGTVKDSVTNTPIPNQELFIKSLSTNTLIHFSDTLYSGNNGKFYKFYTIQNYNSGDSIVISTYDIHNNFYEYFIALDQPAIETDVEIFTPVQNCNAAFHYHSDNSNINTIHFNNNSSGSILSHSYDFDDGNSSNLSNPTHTYASQGIYQVSLSILCANGGSSTQTQSVSVPNQSCQANFSHFCDSIINVDRFYHFQDMTIAPNDQVVGWYWDFDNGSVSYQENPAIQYLNNGKYNVCLTTYTQLSCLNTYCDSVEIESQPHYSFGGQAFSGITPADKINASLYRNLNNQWELIEKNEFDTLGVFHFYNYPIGQYLVQSSLNKNDPDHDAFFPTYLGDVLHWQNAISFNNDKEDWNRDIQLFYKDPSTLVSGNGKISGKVQNQSQQALIDIEIMLFDEQSQALKYTFTNSLGEYEFQDLPLGKYQIFPEICGVTTTPSWVEILSTTLFVNNIDFSLGNQIITGKQEQVFSEQIQFKVFPNPTADLINISISKTDISKYEIEIFDVTGQKIYLKPGLLKYLDKRIIIDFSSLSSGYYMLNIKSLDNGYIKAEKVLRK